MKHLPNLLIVDDSRENLYLLESVIKDVNVNLIQADSGKDALEKTQGLEIALAIIDVRMPGMNGFELALKMNEDRTESKVPVIFLTASHFSEVDILKGYSSSAVDYIFKPFDNYKLLCKIKIFLDLFNQKQTIIRETALLKKTAAELARVNIELKINEEKYRNYIDNAPDGVFVTDEYGKYIEVNNAFCQITAYSKEELLKMAVSDLLPKEALNEGLAHFNNLIQTGVSSSDLQFRHKNNTNRWWTVDAVKISEKRFLGFTKDITQRKQMEEALRINQLELEMQNDELLIAKNAAIVASEKYTELFNFAPSGYFILSKERIIQEQNQSGSLILGISKQRSLLPNDCFDSFISKDTLPVFDAFFQQIYKTRTKKTCEVIIETEDHPPKYVYIEGILAGLSGQCLLNVVDITERKSDEKEISRINSFLDSVIDNIPNMLFLKDAKNLNFVRFNHAGEQLLGIPKEELIGKNDYDFFTKEEADSFTEKDRMVLRNGGLLDITEENIHTRHLGKRILHTKKVAVLNVKGKPEYLLGISEDITMRKKIEDELKESESNLAEAQQIAHFGSWEWDMITNKVKWSKEMFRIFDIDPATYDENPQAIIKVLHPDDLAVFSQSMNSNLSRGNSPSLEYRIIHRDGSIHYLAAEGRMEFDKAGKVFKSIGTVQDITERKRIEQFLKEKENRLNKTQEIAHLGSWELDIQTNELSWSDEVYRIYGILPNESMLSYNDYLKLIHPEDLEIVQTIYADSIADEKDVFELEHRIIRKSTAEVRYVYEKCEHIKDTSGKIVRSVGMVHDITDRKNEEIAIKVSEEKYRTILNASPDGILLINLKGIITEVSEIGLELFGADDRNDLIGKNISRFIPTNERNSVKEIFEKTMSEGLVQNYNLKIRKKNQTVFPSETSVTLIQDTEGIPLSYMVIIRDISQRMKIETKQIHADRMANLGEMASGIAHEINQPLNIISMVMDRVLFETTKAQKIDNEFLKTKSNKIFENILRIRNIIDHIRAFSRTHDDYILTAFDVNASIENAVSMISEQFKHLGVNLTIELDKRISQILGNTFKFEQVIINLLVNAKDAVVEKKKTADESFELQIGIRSYQLNQSLIVEVSDNGSGISESDISNIILPFYTTKEEGKGTGLGLSICYQIIKEMNGSIDITSNAVDGTKFKIVFDV